MSRRTRRAATDTPSLRALLAAAQRGGWTVTRTAELSAWATAQALTQTLDDARTRDRVARGVWRRLEALAPHKDAARAALRALMHPRHAPAAARQVWTAADAIWAAAGDTATDYNRITKRLLLSGVIAATTAFWLNDTSKNHLKTRAFLDARIENVLKLGQGLGRFKPSASSAAPRQRRRPGQ